MPIRVPEDAHRLFVEGFNAGDVEALVALYEPEGVLMDSDGRAIKGRPAIREGLQGFLASGAKLSLTTRSVVACGDLALLRSDWEMNGASPSGKPLHSAHSSTEVVRRQPDGTWLYVIDNPFGAD